MIRFIKMAGDKFRSKVLSSALILILVLNTAVFLSLTVVQLLELKDIEEKLATRRTEIKQLRATCVGRSQSLQTIFDELVRVRGIRQASGITSSFIQDLVNAQEQILLKSCTPDTIICIKGEKGDQGDHGPKGFRGQKGDEGLLGRKGEQGKDGPKGIKGNVGPRGQKGISGSKSTRGEKGDTGVIGQKGIHGTKGSKGEPGQKGVNGEKGYQGYRGAVGLKGEKGERGSKGDGGLRGIKGSKGSVGDEGPRGPAFNNTCDCIKKPQFKPSLKMLSAKFGDNLTLDCSTTPESPVKLVKTDQSGCFSNTTSDSGIFVFKEFSPVDVGVYQCIAENILGKTSTFVTLNSSDVSEGVSCRFESGFCKWIQNKADDFDFNESTGTTSGPTSDHTIGRGGAGHFLYFNGSSGTTGQTARLESLFISANHTRCLSFWYFMQDANSGTLSLKTADCNLSERDVWKTKPSSASSQWHKVSVELPVDAHGQKLIFEASRGRTVSNIAIDDIDITDNSCPAVDVKPDILNKNATITIQKGGQILLICNATGQPTPNISWVKASDCDPRSLTRHHQTTVTITSASVSDGGIYKCQASNTAGTAKSYFNVIVNETNPLCTFDKGLDRCEWANVKTEKLDWNRQNENTPSSNTGPSHDHTRGNSAGYYMFIESSSPALQGDIAQLQYKTLPAGQPFCFDFWYHMYGTTMGTLKVVAEECVSNKSTILWSKSGDQGDQWIRQCLDIEQHTHDFSLQIEGIRGTSYHSDMAIDDLKVSNGRCNCRKDVNISCDFENGLCSGKGFQLPLKANNFKWIRQSGQTTSIDTGPNSDHTSGHGFYIYVEASNGITGESAMFLSPQLPQNEALCLQFWYNMYGDNMGTLNIVTVAKGANPSSPSNSVIFTKKGNQGQSWKLAKVDIPSQSTPYRVEFQAVKGNSFRSDAAIDDINISLGPCN